MASRETHFNVDWINPDLNPKWSKWLLPVKGKPKSAFCKKCFRTFSLSNMGVQAIKSHENGKTHIKIMQSENIRSVSSMFKDKLSSVNIEDNCSQSNNLKITSKTKTIDEFVIKKETKVAECLWALRIVMNQESFNSCKDDGYLFKRMFTDSSIVSNFSLGPDKASYLINYGLAPYFANLLEKQVLECETYVVCFDEAMNKIAQKGQMDVHIRFWCNVKQQVSTRYFNSAFLTKSRAEDLLQGFKQSLDCLILGKILQISMDGPSVNWKFLRLFKSEMELNEDEPKLIDIGSCGLHVIHGAFESGCNKVGWKINKFLRGLFYLFKDSPARRSEYTSISGSNLFPKKFCQIRWLENVSCAERAILIFECVKKYFNEKKFPTTISTTTIKNIDSCLKDPMMLAQLAFFKMLGEKLQPFLIKFQGREPLSPFLYPALFDLTKDILRHFVKKNIVDNATSAKKLSNIDLDDNENLLKCSEINIGFTATKYLNKSKANEKEKNYFKMDCRMFLKTTVNKILERSPLSYNLTRGISCLVPELIVKNPSLAQQRMDVCLKIFNENNRLSEKIAENTQKEFFNFCQYAQENKETFLNFMLAEERLDSFYSQILYDVKKFENLWIVIKMILIISHGNATVESGFSINRQLLVENLHEESLVSQRLVYDYVLALGGLCNVEISDKMLLALKGSRARWGLALENKKKKEEENKNSLLVRKKHQHKIKELMSKKIKLSQTASLELKNIETEILKKILL